jgi:assimilatory nitrate reductase catalytic subunit
MHYDITNQLTRADFDPHSRQPSYKYCAVSLRRSKASAQSASSFTTRT